MPALEIFNNETFDAGWKEASFLVLSNRLDNDRFLLFYLSGILFMVELFIANLWIIGFDFQYSENFEDRRTKKAA